MLHRRDDPELGKLSVRMQHLGIQVHALLDRISNCLPNFNAPFIVPIPSPSLHWLPCVIDQQSQWDQGSQL